MAMIASEIKQNCMLMFRPWRRSEAAIQGLDDPNDTRPLAILDLGSVTMPPSSIRKGKLSCHSPCGSGRHVVTMIIARELA